VLPILKVVFVALLTASGGAIAQDLDAAWLVGSWQSETQSPRGRAVEIVVKSDGSFQGEEQSARLGTVQFRDGKWEIAGDTVTFNYRTDVQKRFKGQNIDSSTWTWTLKRNGEDLEGTRVDQSTSRQNAIKLKKSK